jgi:hypothetical protein
MFEMLLFVFIGLVFLVILINELDKLRNAAYAEEYKLKRDERNNRRK